jgi:tetratricopeptide (TPR) repeat protein
LIFIVNRTLAFFLMAASLPVCGQIPRAEPVPEDPALRADPGRDFYMRGQNAHDAAARATDLETRKLLYERASDILARYLTDFPNHENAERAWWYLGNSYYQSGHIEDAKRCFHTLLNRYGKGVWAGLAAFTLGRDHYEKGEFAFAAPMFERFAANAARPEEAPRGYFLAADCYRRLGRDREAAANYRKVTEHPAGALYAPQSKVQLGYLATKSGKLKEALDYFEEVVAGQHTAAIRGEAALQAAITATKLDQPDLSDRYLRTIMTSEGMEAFRPDAQIALMSNYFSKGEYREVIQLYRRSTLKAEGEREAQRLMLAAQSHYRLKESEQAHTLFREVEAMLPPENDLAFRASYYRLLCSFQIEGRHMIDQVDAFLHIYRRARPKDMHVHTALMIKAETLFADGQAEAAAKVYSEIDAAIVSDNNRPGLLFKRGWCLAEAGDLQGAIRSLGEFITKYPDDERRHRALARRAKAFTEAGEPAKAIADYDRLLTDGAPADLTSFAWLESARLRRSENNFQDAVVRYKGLLQNVENLSDTLRGEANYWIGWGLVKSDAPGEAVSHLEKARELRPQTYAKHAGLLLALGYYTAQDAPKLAGEINIAIDGNYDADIPDQAMQWAGMQSYNAGDYAAAARFLERVSNPDEPRETAKGIWRFLAKARLETGDFAGALSAATNVLEVEDNAGWKADGLHDKARALFELDRADEAREATDEGLALRPPPRTTAQLRILSGELKLKGGNPAEAAAEFLTVASFSDDEELKPRALWLLEKALESKGDTAEAAKYRQQRESEFPGWKTAAP